MSGVEIFKLFLEKTNDANIPLVMLRPREISKEVSYSGDYDFFVEPEYNDRLLEIMFDVAVSKNISFSITAIKYGKIDIDIYDSFEDKKIALEIWNTLSVKDSKTLRYIKPQNLKAYISKQDTKFVLDIDVEVLYYLSHLHTGKKKLQTPLVQERILHYKKTKTSYLHLLDGLKENKDIKTVSHKANMELVRLGILSQKSDTKERVLEIIAKTNSTCKRVWRKLFKLFNMIAIMGPDGVGKTTIIKNTTKAIKKKTKLFKFKKTFRNSPIYKLLMPFLKKRVAKRFKHMSIGKSEVDDIYGGFVIFNAYLMYPLRLLRVFITREITFIDRYFNEYLLENTRFFDKKAKLRDNWKFLSYFTPRPRVIVQLDAPEDVILKRKDELDGDGIRAFRYGIFKTVLNKKPQKYLYINTTIPPQRCESILLDAIK